MSDRNHAAAPHHNPPDPAPPPVFRASRSLLLGARGRCPCCGVGKLFASYLKQREKCDACGEPLGNLRADDGPAWLTILLTGHVIAPLILHYVRDPFLPEFLAVGILATLTIALALLLLPVAKGFFIAALWVLYVRRKG